MLVWARLDTELLAAIVLALVTSSYTYRQVMSEAAAFYNTGAAIDCFSSIIQHTLSMHSV